MNFTEHQGYSKPSKRTFFIAAHWVLGVISPFLEKGKDVGQKSEV